MKISNGLGSLHNSNRQVSFVSKRHRTGADRLQFLWRPAVMCAAILVLLTGARAADPSEWSEYDAGVVGSDGFDWRGGYAGISTGVSDTGTRVTAAGSRTTKSRLDAAFSVFGGYNWQVSRVVLGVEGELAYLGREAKGNHAALGRFTSKSTWSAALKGRVGLPIGRFMPYLSAGLAATGQTFTANRVKDKAVGVGPTFGAGLEVAMTNKVRVRADYSLTGILDTTMRFGGTSTRRQSANHRLMIGVSYAF